MPETDAPPPPLVPGAVHAVEVAGRDERARGTSTLGRRTLRVANALEGEALRVRLVHVGRHVAVGRIAEVLSASPDRVEDACPHGEVCPGCGLRTSSVANRRAFKVRRLVEELGAAGFPETVVGPIVPAPYEDGWRHKAFLTARRTTRGLFLGLFEEHSHRLVGIDGCPAHAAAVERVLAAARRVLARFAPPIYDERSGAGWLRSVAVRASATSGEALLTLVARDGLYPGLPTLARALLEECPPAVGVTLNVNPGPGNAPFGSRSSALAGRAWIEEASGPFRLRVSAGSFFQVNPPVGALLHDAVALAARLAPPGPAVDLYAGVGATAVRLAADGREVFLVEAPGPSVEDARFNAERSGNDRVRVIEGKVEEEAGRLLAKRPSVVVANPPRSGLGASVLAALAANRTPRLVYVACEPRALARDARALAGSGYRLESVTPFDLMPQTPHVEALAVLASEA